MVHRRWRQGQRRRRANTSQISKTVTYTYDAAGKVTGIKYPSGRQLSVTYTGGQPSAMALARNATAAPVDLISDIRWEPFGGVKSWQWQLASGTQLHERVHDTSGRPVRYRLGANLRDLTYDAADRIVAYTHYAAAGGAPQPALDQGFAYDELGRLRTVTTASANWSIHHDANGNRTSLTLNGTSPSVYTVLSTSNRLDSVTTPLRSFGYDAAGNTVSDSASHTASFNLAGRLASLTKGGVSTTYSVDGLGRRVRKFDTSGAASTTVFVYDAGGQLLGEYGSTGTPLREYVWLGGTPVAVFTPDPTGATKPPLVYFIHTDHLDTPRLVLDKSNNLRWSWVAEPFGTTAANPNPQGLGVFVFNLRFPGQYFDQESGLHYNYFRDYDATLGRYVQSDPIGLAAGINTYAYVSGNPVTGVDPLGLAETIWSPPGPGRSLTDGPRNGNWGGGKWSGGVGGGRTGSLPPVDSGDACYMRHDQCWDNCRGNSACKSVCNYSLADELLALPRDSRKWPVPPTPGTERDSESFRDGAIRLFSPPPSSPPPSVVMP